MSILKHISQIFESAKEIPFDNSSKIVLMSDCHRGNGSWADNFSKNQNIYFVALTHYYNRNYTYIELGDGDELWENSNFSDIINMHSDAFWLLSKFYKKNRMYFIYGNHDLQKKNISFVENNLYKYYNEPKEKYVPLFENIVIHEGLVLKYRNTNDKILLIHGHQADPLNSTWWRLSKFLVKNLWKPLETFGVNDPTSPAKNYKKKEAVGDKLSEWSEKEKRVLIAGHTHRPKLPDVGETPYFNTGSCVHPRCITAIEISSGLISLVKWSVKANESGELSIARDVLAGPKKIIDYFN